MKIQGNLSIECSGCKTEIKAPFVEIPANKKIYCPICKKDIVLKDNYIVKIINDLIVKFNCQGRIYTSLN